MAKYRIVTDRYAGFEVQAWRWWMPIWLQVGVNTFRTAGDAERWAVARHHRVRNSGRVVKVLDRQEQQK